MTKNSRFYGNFANGQVSRNIVISIFCIADDENGDLAALDSGSDFENDLKKQNNNPMKNPKISSSSEEISSGVDENEDEEELKSPVNKTKLKNLVPNKTKLLMKQRENLLEGPKKVKNLPLKQKNSILPSSSMTTISKSLSLSESDDSDLEDQKPSKPPKMAKIRKSSKKVPQKSTKINFEESESDFSGEEIDFSSQLECLAQSQTFKLA